MHRQPVRTGKTRRPPPDNGNLFACGRGPLIELQVVAHSTIGGVALQQPNFHRFALSGLADTGLLAQCFRGADTGAHAAKDVLVKNGFCRAIQIARRNLPDEFWDIDRSGTGRDARRVIAEIAAVSLD